MVYARKLHAAQRRKYTSNPYVDHLAEVAGIVATVNPQEIVLATAWMHDSIEDQGVAYDNIVELFGVIVARGVLLLSDLEVGNRAERNLAKQKRLGAAPGWVQNVKCADLISNASSIVEHDPKFGITYLKEMRALIECLNEADPGLLAVAEVVIEAGLSQE